MTTERPVGTELEWRPPRRPAATVLEGRYMPNGPYRDATELREALKLAGASEDPVAFVLVRLPDEQPAGIATYMRITPEHGVIEIGGIWFGASLRRTPAATEAIYMLASHAFDELGYRRLEWKCDSLNAASRRAAERFGFRFEGVFRNHMVVKSRSRDTAWHAITDEEWPAVRAGFRAWLKPGNFDQDGRQRHPLAELIAQHRSGRASG